MGFCQSMALSQHPGEVVSGPSRIDDVVWRAYCPRAIKSGYGVPAAAGSAHKIATIASLSLALVTRSWPAEAGTPYLLSALAGD
jgi:hypothetical protein